MKVGMLLIYTSGNLYFDILLYVVAIVLFIANIIYGCNSLWTF